MKRFLFMTSLLLTAGSVFADEILHCALFDSHSAGGGSGHPLLREQMKRMKGKTSSPRVGEQIFRVYREKDLGKENTDFFTYHGKLSTSGKTRLEFNNWFNFNVPRRDLLDAGVTVGVTKSGDDEYAFDIDYLDKCSVYGEYFRARTTGLPVPIRPNEWIEVVRFQKGVFNPLWCHVWIYLETAEAAPPVEIATDEQSYTLNPKAAYRVDIICGALPVATVKKMRSFGKEHTRLTAMAIHPWESYSVTCQSEKPFRFDAGRSKLEKIKNPSDAASRLTQVEGKLQVFESSMTLSCQILPAVERKRDAMVIPFRGDLVLGAWMLQEVKDGPKMGEFYPRWDSGIATRDNSAVNVAAYRITQL